MNPVPLLHDLLLEAARSVPDKAALVARGERLTYAEVDARSNALAHALVRRGVRPRDRVLVFAENRPEVTIAFWGVLKANAVVSIVHPSTKSDKLAYLLNDCGAAALIADAQLAPVFCGAVARAPSLRAILAIGRVAAELGAAVPGLVEWTAALSDGPRSAPPKREAIDIDLAALIYTSGSTGEPKGVMLTHRNMRAAAASIGSYLGLMQDDVLLCVLPLAFNYGLYQMILAAQASARLVLERSFAWPAQVLQTMIDEHVTCFPGVPTLFAVLTELKERSFDLSCVRIVTNTAAALPAKHIRALKEIFPRARIFSMYGLTECKRCTYLPPEDLERKPESVGIPIPNTQLWIVDEHDNRLGPNKVGQLVIRGATVMGGYWGDPEATARKLRQGPLPGEKVLYTGDYCRLDEEGYLYFVSRMDEVVKSRGEKVAPREVENAIVAIEGVREAAVIGVPDEVLGQAVKAFVLLERDARLTERDIAHECQKRLESFMVPKHIAIVADLPRTTTGKIRKTGLA
jgi:amino acid adenylation domain-containing protein